MQIKITSMPLTTWPKTTCFPSSQGAAAVVMKNCDPFVCAPLFAIDNKPGLEILEYDVMYVYVLVTYRLIAFARPSEAFRHQAKKYITCHVLE